jgi:Methyltransferase domain
MKTLVEIGHDHQCDKGDAQHSHAGESYFDTYERFFAPLRGEPINFLELGVRDGKSLRIWREYFEKANIIGVDINPQSAHQDTKGCEVHICSQDDAATLTTLSIEEEGWDIVMDDASHLNVLTAESFKILWKHVRPKGLYIIEDLRVSYSDLSKLPSHWNFVDLHPDNPTRNNDRGILNDIFFKLISDLDIPQGDVRAIHFYHQIAIIEKI